MPAEGGERGREDDQVAEPGHAGDENAANLEGSLARQGAPGEPEPVVELAGDIDGSEHETGLAGKAIVSVIGSVGGVGGTLRGTARLGWTVPADRSASAPGGDVKGLVDPAFQLVGALLPGVRGGRGEAVVAAGLGGVKGGGDRLEILVGRLGQGNGVATGGESFQGRGDHRAAGGEVFEHLQRAARLGQLILAVGGQANVELADDSGQVLVRLISEQVDVRLGGQRRRVVTRFDPACKDKLPVALEAGQLDQHRVIQSLVHLADEAEARVGNGREAWVRERAREAFGSEMGEVGGAFEEGSVGVEQPDPLEQSRRDGEGQVHAAKLVFLQFPHSATPGEFLVGGATLGLGGDAVGAPLINGVIDRRRWPDGRDQRPGVGTVGDRHRGPEAQPMGHVSRDPRAPPEVASPAEGCGIGEREDPEIRLDLPNPEAGGGGRQGLPGRRQTVSAHLPVRIDVQDAMPTARQAGHELLLARPAIVPVLLPEAKNLAHRNRCRRSL